MLGNRLGGGKQKSFGNLSTGRMLTLPQARGLQAASL
jgi:hypothetical protein